MRERIEPSALEEVALSFHRRIIRWVQKLRLNLLGQLAVDLRFGLRLLPLRVLAELLEGLIPSVFVGEGENVNQRVLRALSLAGRPITNVGHPVLLKELHGVIAEARLKRIELPLVGGVRPQLEKPHLRLLVR